MFCRPPVAGEHVIDLQLGVVHVLSIRPSGALVARDCLGRVWLVSSSLVREDDLVLVSAFPDERQPSSEWRERHGV